MKLLAFALLLGLTDSALSASDNSLPPDSIYHLQVSLEDQDGLKAGLDQFKGQPVLVTMFYANCPHVCPLIVSTIKFTESELSDEQKMELRVLTISIDPERDTPALLKETMERHSVDNSRWQMVRSERGDVRAIAGVLGIKYKQLPDGEFNHSTKIILIDREGRQIAMTQQLGRHDPQLLEAIRASLK
jgi:protein SCO1/2